MGRVLIVGSIALDTVQTPYGRVEEELGGAGTYASCAASLMAPVRLVGVVGGDFPQEHLDLLASRGIDLSGVERRAEGRSFRWVGAYSGDMGQAKTLDTQLNVFADFQPTLPGDYRQTEVVFLANIHPQLQLNVLEQCAAARFALADTMNLWIESEQAALLEVLKRVDLALLNDAEVRMLTGANMLPRAARAVLELGPRYVVIKRGEHGALLASREEFFAAPAFPLLDVRDPTGAGDSFAGGLAGLLARLGKMTWDNLRRAVVVGTVMSSYCCEDFGLRRLQQVTEEDLLERYEILRGMTEIAAWNEPSVGQQ